MFAIDSKAAEQLGELEDVLLAEQGTIDAMIVLARCGLGERPFSHLLSLYAGPLADWQAAELSETLAELLDAVDELIDEGYTDEWEPELEQRVDALLASARSLEDRAEAASD